MKNVKHMAYKSWSPLWSVIVESSLWDEPDWIVKIFLTMLAKKDSDHIYRGTAYQLHKDSRKTEVEVLEALKVLSSPDTIRKEPQPYEGRRVQAVPEGWLILNGELYRDMVAIERRRRSNARAQEKFRQKQKLAHQYPVSGTPQAGEAGYVRTLEREGQAVADAQMDRQQLAPVETATQRAQREYFEAKALRNAQNGTPESPGAGSPTSAA